MNKIRYCALIAGDWRLSFVVGVALIVGFSVFTIPSVGLAEEPSPNWQERRAELEVKKLELETARLEDWPGWASAFLAFIGGIVATSTTVWGARRARKGTLDQAVHEKRLQRYPRLIKATGPLALYFPTLDESGQAKVTPRVCEQIGRAMSKWYFGGGGLLLSKQARDDYFRFARGLTLASKQTSLRVPQFPDDALLLCSEKLDEYRKKLSEELKLACVDDWTFEAPIDENTPRPEAAVRFKDYVFLQQLSSTLRTALAKDLRSRRRPK